MIKDDYTPGYNPKRNCRNLREDNFTWGKFALSVVFFALVALDAFLIFSL